MYRLELDLIGGWNLWRINPLFFSFCSRNWPPATPAVPFPASHVRASTWTRDWFPPATADAATAAASHAPTGATETAGLASGATETAGLATGATETAGLASGATETAGLATGATETAGLATGAAEAGQRGAEEERVRDPEAETGKDGRVENF